MRSRTRRLAALLAVGSLLALSACSDSTSDSGPADSSDSGDDGTVTTRGITDDSIKVGGSLYSVYYGGADVGVQARIKEANDAGGINGRMIEYVGAEDTNNESSKDLDNITRLVEQEEVFAILPGLTGVPGGGDYIVENDVPMFGWGTSPAYCNNEVAFGITGCVSNPSLDVGSNALGVLLQEHFDGDTDKSVAFIGEDNDSGRGGITLLSESAAAGGYDVVYAETPLPAPPEVLGDESPFVTELLSADGGDAPDVIYLVATLSGTKLAAALQDAGYEGMIITPSYSPLLLGQPGYDGVYINTQFSMDPEVPANAAMLESVAAIDPDQQFDLAVAAGYWAADLFIQALEETGPDLSVESLLDTINSGDFTFSVDEVIGEGTWPEGHELSTPCAALTEVQGDQFVPVIPLTCGENIELN